MSMEDVGATSTAPDSSTASPPPSIGGSAEPTTSEPVETQDPQEVSIDDELRQIYRNHNRERDEATGRFKAKVTDQAQTNASEQAKPAIEMPRSWSADRNVIWETLSPEARELIAGREKEASDKISQQGQQISEYQSYGDALDYVRSRGDELGLEGSQVLSNLVNADRMLTNPQTAYQAIAAIADAYNIDLRQFGGQTQEGQQSASPGEARLLQHIAQLEARLDATENREQGRVHRERETQVKTIQDHVLEFSKDKPDWNDVADDVLDEIRALKSNPKTANLPYDKLLEKAWDRALWANPTTRDRIQKRQTAEAEKKRLEEAKKRADDAKIAASVNVKGKPAAGLASVDIDAELRQIYRRNHG